MEHISEHLKTHAANDSDFRSLIGEPRMGKVCDFCVSEVLRSLKKVKVTVKQRHYIEPVANSEGGGSGGGSEF